MKTGLKLIQAAVAAAALLAFAPFPGVAQAPAGGAAKMSMSRLPPESLVLRSDVIADMGLKVGKDTTVGDIMASLTPEQRKRLDQIGLQMLGNNALRIADVQAELKLTPDQVRRLEEIGDNNMREFMKIRDSDLDAEAIQAAFAARRKKAGEELLAVLTDSQRSAWEAMNGKPFKQDMSLGMSMTAPPSSATPPPKEKPLLSAGTPAPDFEALTVDGKPVRLSDYRGKVVVLDFWATWCGPCIAGLPGLNETARRTQGQDVVFLALNVWDAPREFEKWLGINPAGESREGDGITKRYNVTGIPTTYVIGRDGRIVGAPKFTGGTSNGGGRNLTIATSGTPDEELVKMLRECGITVR